jgi:prepilin-type N-terminal cleavage/methylation domain-containing protein
MSRNEGFTLIEMVVVTAVVAIMMVSVTGILLSSLQARNLTRMADVVAAEGGSALEEIRKNLLNAGSETVNCPVGVGSSLSYVSVIDSQTTTITCVNGDKIASNSARLSGADVALTGCDDFVKCSTGGAGTVTKIEVKFTLGSGNPSEGVKHFVNKTFGTTVTLRN